jgi:hypothetical protein
MSRHLLYCCTNILCHFACETKFLYGGASYLSVLSTNVTSFHSFGTYNFKWLVEFWGIFEPVMCILVTVMVISVISERQLGF